MAVVRNITQDVLSLFRPDAVPVRPGKEVEVVDADFAGRAWPKSTWALVKKPVGKGFVDVSIEDAYVFLPASADEAAETQSDTEESA